MKGITVESLVRTGSCSTVRSQGWVLGRGVVMQNSYRWHGWVFSRGGIWRTVLGGRVGQLAGRLRFRLQ